MLKIMDGCVPPMVLHVCVKDNGDELDLLLQMAGSEQGTCSQKASYVSLITTFLVVQYWTVMGFCGRLW